MNFVKEGTDLYLDRLRHYQKISWEELPNIKKIDRTKTELLKTKEGELILSKIEANEQLVLLDENGKWLDSHTIGIDGPLLHLDENDPTLLHVWLLSFERHALVGHYTIQL